MVLALLLASPSTALRPTTIALDPCIGHDTTAKQAGPFIERVWDQDRWRRGKPKHSTIRAYRDRLRCAGPENRKALKHRWGEARKSYGRWRTYRQIAPYPGDGSWWAVPWYVVSCESHGLWSAYNPSGAAGPYQIMAEWGRPWPVTSWHDKMAHHRLAGEIWSGGGGASNWACA